MQSIYSFAFATLKMYYIIFIYYNSLNVDIKIVYILYYFIYTIKHQITFSTLKRKYIFFNNNIFMNQKLYFLFRLMIYYNHINVISYLYLD